MSTNITTNNELQPTRTDEERRELADHIKDAEVVLRKLLDVQASREEAAARANADPNPEHQPPPEAPSVGGVTLAHLDSLAVVADIIRPESEETL